MEKISSPKIKRLLATGLLLLSLLSIPRASAQMGQEGGLPDLKVKVIPRERIALLSATVPAAAGIQLTACVGSTQITTVQMSDGSLVRYDKNLGATSSGEYEITQEVGLPVNGQYSATMRLVPTDCGPGGYDGPPQFITEEEVFGFYQVDLPTVSR